MNFHNTLKSKFSLFYQVLFPFRYNKDRYAGTFLINNVFCQHANKDVNEIVYCFWTGNNPMTENREKAFKLLCQNAGVPVKLIHPENLNNYILTEYPLHEAYSYLSLVHKSDYLRCYFMHHYGGGYSDIKACKYSWKNSFIVFNKSDKILLGYKEINRYAVPVIDGKLGKDLKTYFLSVKGNCAYICRPYTSFTTEWFNELHRRLDLYLPELKKCPGNVMGDNEGYPIRWTGILGDIFHPLCLKYHDKMMDSPAIKPDFSAYR